MLSCFGCKTKPTEQKTASDVKVSEKKQDDAVYPFADISADGITEVFFGFIEQKHLGYECTKSYTDADAIAKIIDFLNKAPKLDVEVDPEGGTVGSVSPYVIELKTSDGKTKYDISFDHKTENEHRTAKGNVCFFANDGAEEIEVFYIESEYLYDLILHIATLDGRQPWWESDNLS